MSKKRTSAESSNDELKKEGSVAVFQQVDSAKRGKFTSLSDTTLHDLPMEMLECILVKAVAMEVKDMKLAKSVWKEKADIVIGRLRTVCSHWSSILATNFFRNEVHRALDGTAQETIRLEIVHQSLIHCTVMRVTTMKDEILVLCCHFDQITGFTFDIEVYDRNNMAEVKDVIALPGIRPANIAACNVTNCVYLLEQHRLEYCASIFRITRDEEHQSNIQTWISDLSFSVPYMSVSVKGSLIIISTLDDLDSDEPDELASDGLYIEYKAVSIYSPSGFLCHEVMLSPDIYGFRYVKSVIQISNGNLVLAAVSEQCQTVLMEIDTNGIIERQYKSSLRGGSGVNFADTSDRMLINSENGIELLDSELNHLDFTGPQTCQDDFPNFYRLHYNSERVELVGVRVHSGSRPSVLTILRFSEE